MGPGGVAGTVVTVEINGVDIVPIEKVVHPINPFDDMAHKVYTGHEHKVLTTKELVEEDPIENVHPAIV